MMKKEKLTKAQYSKNLRRVLLRHQVDLTNLQFNASSHSVSLSGLLIKNTGEDLSVQAIIELQKELSSMGQIVTDLANWILTNDSITKIERDSNGHLSQDKNDEDDAA